MSSSYNQYTVSNKGDNWLCFLIFPKQWTFRNEYRHRCGLYLDSYIGWKRRFIILCGRRGNTVIIHCMCNYSSHGDLTPLLSRNDLPRTPWCCLPMILFPLAGVVPITKESLSCRKLSNVSSASPDHVLSVLIPLQACALKLDLQSMPSGDLLGIPVMTCHEGGVRTKEARDSKNQRKFKFYEVHKPQWSWWLVIYWKFCRVIISVGVVLQTPVWL